MAPLNKNSRILPPCARHLVYTVADGMMAGVHFFNFTLLYRSFCGFVLTAFTGRSNTNAAHDDFISILQAHSTLWRGAFDDKLAVHMDSDGPGTVII